MGKQVAELRPSAFIQTDDFSIKHGSSRGRQGELFAQVANELKG